ncbi:hypothetical protein F5Y16DRAFT_268721 [Xylariaceae sp. FL0255]|nr:hypothetical protein F5Y16DRAFT_268721 [Xylariaceae sp. FL0255]
MCLMPLTAPKKTWIHSVEVNGLLEGGLCKSDRVSMTYELSKITGIGQIYLLLPERYHDANIATRISWASKRRTSRQEDHAYCLLGLMEVNMPLLYGEGGSNAFIRLKQEIIRSRHDHTLFCWGLMSGAGSESQDSYSEPAPDSSKKERPVCLSSILAHGPEDFANFANWNPSLRLEETGSHYLTTNLGLLIDLPLISLKPPLGITQQKKFQDSAPSQNSPENLDYLLSMVPEVCALGLLNVSQYSINRQVALPLCVRKAGTTYRARCAWYSPFFVHQSAVTWASTMRSLYIETNRNTPDRYGPTMKMDLRFSAPRSPNVIIECAALARSGYEVSDSIPRTVLVLDPIEETVKLESSSMVTRIFHIKNDKEDSYLMYLSYNAHTWLAGISSQKRNLHFWEALLRQRDYTEFELDGYIE